MFEDLSLGSSDLNTPKTAPRLSSEQFGLVMRRLVCSFYHKKNQKTKLYESIININEMTFFTKGFAFSCSFHPVSRQGYFGDQGRGGGGSLTEVLFEGKTFRYKLTLVQKCANSIEYGWGGGRGGGKCEKRSHGFIPLKIQPE